MTAPTDLDADIAKTLALRHIAALGFSDKPARASHFVSIYLAHAGYRVIGVNALLAQRYDLPLSVVESLSDMPPPIDILLVFRPSDDLPELAESAARRGAKVLWLQEGVSHPEAAARGRAAGLTVVEGRCLLKEHAEEERRRESAAP